MVRFNGWLCILSNYLYYMDTEELQVLLTERKVITSAFLERDVKVDFYLPKNISNPKELSLLLINDGQDLEKMNFDLMLDGLIETGQVQPLLCVGIHASVDRKMEYGTTKILDFGGRGAKADAYEQFILEELLPLVHTDYCIESFKSTSFAGFSLGGLTAIDTVFAHPEIFTIAGVFSGSLWWRRKDINDGYDEEQDRIMHLKIREGKYNIGQKFFFSTGSLDETADRNNNGIIDSIDDTLGLIEELEKKGYDKEKDIKYINFEDGKHDVETWGRAMPLFLLWGWSVKSN